MFEAIPSLADLFDFGPALSRYHGQSLEISGVASATSSPVIAGVL